jgi:WXG100 family type VII secretion target
MTYIKVTSGDLANSSVQLSARAARIAEENTLALGVVEGLVGASWDGAASAEFNQLFLRWKAGADEVQSALAGIGALLDSAATAYQHTEDAINASLSQ